MKRRMSNQDLLVALQKLHQLIKEPKRETSAWLRKVSGVRQGDWHVLLHEGIISYSGKNTSTTWRWDGPIPNVKMVAKILETPSSKLGWKNPRTGAKVATPPAKTLLNTGSVTVTHRYTIKRVVNGEEFVLDVESNGTKPQIKPFHTDGLTIDGMKACAYALLQGADLLEGEDK